MKKLNVNDISKIIEKSPTQARVWMALAFKSESFGAKLLFCGSKIGYQLQEDALDDFLGFIKREKLKNKGKRGKKAMIEEIKNKAPFLNRDSAIKLAITGGKGGIGKTTVANLLVQFFGLYCDVKVLVVDLDENPSLSQLMDNWSVSLGLENKNERGIVDILQGKSAAENIEVINEKISYIRGHVDVDMFFNGENVKKDYFSKIFGEVEKDFDIIIFDVHPAKSSMNLALSYYADFNLFPSPTDISTPSTIYEYIEKGFREMWEDDFELNFGILLNKYSRPKTVKENSFYAVNTQVFGDLSPNLMESFLKTYPQIATKMNFISDEDFEKGNLYHVFKKNLNIMQDVKEIANEILSKIK